MVDISLEDDGIAIAIEYLDLNTNRNVTYNMDRISADEADKLADILKAQAREFRKRQKQKNKKTWWGP